MNEKQLLFFYGLECEHCIETEKNVDKLIKEGLNILKIEVWHNKENDKLLEELDNGEDCCGGIPFFLNKETGAKICGEASYKEIKKWAEGK